MTSIPEPARGTDEPSGYTVNGRVVFDSTNRTDQTRPASTTDTWIISVDNDRWRALVELLLPSAEIANALCEDDEVGGQLDRPCHRPA